MLPTHLPGPVLVVGTGLIGTSLGLALRACGVDVVLSDPAPSALRLAIALGAGRADDPHHPAEVDVVVVAAPPDVVADVVADQLQARPMAVVTDVASVKALPLQRLLTHGADLSRYVGGHPLAGRERSGAAAAQAELFVGRPWVLTPTAASCQDAIDRIGAVARCVGASMVLMEAGVHDEAVALVSHLPQVAASLVAARLRMVPEQAVVLSGQGLRDVTRIAASSPQLWTQILAANAKSVGQGLRLLRQDLDQLLEALDVLARQPADPAPARAVLHDVLLAGNQGHARIPGKHGTAPARYDTVPVLVPDRPGELARLLTDVGLAGVNIEDLRLEHSEGRPAAVAQVDVLPDAALGLARQLRASGWTVHV